MPEYEDMEIICVDCHKPFIFEAGEQKFFAEKGFTPPKRCKPCRDARKAQKQTSQPRENDFAETWDDDRPRRSHSRRRRRGSNAD